MTDIGADTWIFDWKTPDKDLKQKVSRHYAERIQNGMSFYDWINADKFLLGVIALAARKFAEDGNGFPGDMTEQEWKDTLKTIYEPLEAYCDDSVPCDERQLEEVADALRAFADYFRFFWD